MRKQIVNARIVLTNGIIENGVCCIDDGIITYIGQEPQPKSILTLDADGKYLFPGFIDIHCHGGAGYDFMDAQPDELEQIAKFHLAHGTTTLLATTVTDRWENIRSALDNLTEFISNGHQHNIYGVHLEGPWLSPVQCGAQDIACMDTPNAQLLSELVAKYPLIKRISAAPELPNGYNIGTIGSNLGVIMSVAHTDANFDQIEQAVDHGYTLMTHLYSGMKQTQRENAFRVAGAVEAGLYDDRLCVELIADGRHLPDALLKLVYRCKGSNGICLVTDAMRGAGLPDGSRITLGHQKSGIEVIIEDGVAKLPDRSSFAGSIATTDRLLRTMHLSAGIDLVEVSKMLSGTPANVLKLYDRGAIAVGKRADLVLVNKELNVDSVLLKGEII